MRVLKIRKWQGCVLIVDDTIIPRTCSKKVDLTSSHFSHSDGKHVCGFNMLSVGLFSPFMSKFIPLTFQLLTTSKARKDTAHKYDGRTKLGKYLAQAYTSKFNALISMLKNIKDAGLPVYHVVMDSWFACPIYFITLWLEGYYVTCMLKANNTKYTDANTGEVFTIKNVLDNLEQQLKQGQISNDAIIVRQVLVTRDGCPTIKANICFCKNTQQNKNTNKDDKNTVEGKGSFIALLTTDLSLSPNEIRETYAKRWQIEVQYKALKTNLGLVTGNQSRLITTNLSLIAFCHIRYLMVVFAQTFIFKDATFSEVVEKLAKEDEETYKSGREVRRMLAVELLNQDKKEQISLIGRENNTTSFKAEQMDKCNTEHMSQKHGNRLLHALKIVNSNNELRNALLEAIEREPDEYSDFSRNLINFGTIYKELAYSISTYPILRRRWLKQLGRCFVYMCQHRHKLKSMFYKNQG